MFTHLDFLTKKIGSRPNGSKENKQAAEYIEIFFQKLKYNTLRQFYPSIDWQVYDSALMLNGEKLSVTANGYCKPCKITAPFVTACNLSELDRVNCTKKILILYGDLSKNELEAKPQRKVARYFPRESQQLYKHLENKFPLAIIFIAHHHRKTSLHSDPYYSIPSLTIPINTGKKILHAKNSSNLSIIVHSHSKNSQSWNIIATKPGDNPKKIIISAHFDTKFFSPGAYDNGSGMSLMMTLAEIMAAHHWKYGIEFIAFNSEELGPISGDEIYLNKNGLELLPFLINRRIKPAKVFEDILAVINFDRVGIITGTDTISLFQCSNYFKNIVRTLTNEYPSITYQRSLPCSNHYIFSSYGVPCIFFSSSESTCIAHTADDTQDWLSVFKLSKVQSLAYSIIETLMKKKHEELCKIRSQIII